MIQGSDWIYDAGLAIAILTALYFLAEYFHINKTGFILINLGIALHMLGSQGFYGQTIMFLGYDKIVHFTNGLAIAYAVTNYLIHTIEIKHKAKTATIIFLALSVTTMLGVVMELNEFVGYVYFGEGEGVFMPGDGDVQTLYGEDGFYVDTMMDIIFNTIGAIAGLLIYFSFHRKPQES